MAEPALADLPTDEGSITVIVDSDSGTSGVMKDGTLQVVHPDGSVTIDFAPPGEEPKDVEFNDNLLPHIDIMEQMRIASEVLNGIEADEQSRDQWLQNRARAIDLLGFKMEEPRTDAGNSSAPLEGMSTVRHPLLAEAVIRFQSNASAELLPASGPVKVRNDQPEKPASIQEAEKAAEASSGNVIPLNVDIPAAPPGVTKDELAEALEKDFNHYLTVTDKGYRPDTDRMLFWVGFGGCSFKKIYHDPIKNMPVSRMVDPADLIVSNAATDIENCARVTHRIFMRRSELRRMQILKVYADFHLGQPTMAPDAVQEKTANVQGFNPAPQRPEDSLFTIYESYVELDIKGFEHKKDGKATGLQLPYRVTIDKESRRVLEIRRNYDKDDAAMKAKQVFVKFPFVPTFGFYETGLLHILGNATKALTGAWRIMLDSGMFACFPGFLYSEAVSRQNTNIFRIPPGGGQKLQVGNRDIRTAIMPLPYEDRSAGLAALTEHVSETAQRVGGTAELPVGEGKQDAPVGTTLALIEQATKMLAAVHIRLHAAQSEELQLLKERLRENPDAFLNNKKMTRQWERDEFLAALEETDIVPAADPNTPSHMHRIMKAVAIKQLQAMNPQLYDGKEVDSMIFTMLGVNEYDKLFAPPQPAGPVGPDPTVIAKVQADMQKFQLESQAKAKEQQADAEEADRQAEMRAHEVAIESSDRAADRQSRERVAQKREDTERIKAILELVKNGLLDPHAALSYLTGRPMPPMASGFFPGGAVHNTMIPGFMANAGRGF